LQPPGLLRPCRGSGDRAVAEKEYRPAYRRRQVRTGRVWQSPRATLEPEGLRSSSDWSRLGNLLQVHYSWHGHSLWRREKEAIGVSICRLTKKSTRRCAIVSRKCLEPTTPRRRYHDDG